MLTKEIRQLVSYAKRARIKRIKLGEIEIEFADKAFINERKLKRVFEDTASRSETEAEFKRDLFWSTK